jgi:hypothetical protein
MHKKLFSFGLGALLIGATVFSSVAHAAEERSGNIYQLGEEHEELMATPNASSGSCGVERWSVKVGTDPDAGLVNLNNPVIQTITYLRSQTAPASPPLNSRVQPTETTLFVVDATLVEYKLENDSDYHMVIKDAAGNTMIAEIADPACVSGGPFANLIQNARNEFDAKYSATTSFQTANIPVQITGVGFFDFLHGQTGVAPNGIELHPVLDVIFNPGSGGANFALSASPGNVSVMQGSSATTTITETPQNGFTGSVALSASGLPTGVTASFSPSSTTGTSTLTLTASAVATAGTSTVTITGTSGSLTHTTTINVTVAVSGGGGAQTAVYSSTLKAPDCATVGTSCDSGPSLLLGRATLAGGTEPNQPNTINSSCADGTSGTFHSDESNDRLVVATTDGSPLAAGKTVKISATVWAYSATADALDLYSAANANSPTWVFLNTITPSAAGAQTLTTTFTLPSGSLQAIRANFRYQGSASACSTGAYDDHDDLVFAVGGSTPTPDFTMAASPASAAVAQGSSVSDTITITPQNGFSGSVALTASGLPSGVTATFSPSSTTGTSTLTLTASSTATTGAATVTIKGTSGSLTHTATVNLTVNAGGGTVTELIVNGGFESGTTPWTATSGVITNATGESAHGGSYFAWLDGYGTATTDTVVQTVSIPSTATTATLSFWLHIDTAETSTTTAYDTLTVQLQNSSGGVLATLATYSNLNKNTGYAQKSFDVSTYKGQSVKVYFKGVEDAQKQTSFVIDDVSLKSQ